MGITKPPSADARAAGEIVDILIDNFCYNQEDIDTILAIIADKKQDEVMDWMKRSIHLVLPEGVDRDDIEYQWA